LPPISAKSFLHFSLSTLLHPRAADCIRSATGKTSSQATAAIQTCKPSLQATITDPEHIGVRRRCSCLQLSEDQLPTRWEMPRESHHL